MATDPLCGNALCGRSTSIADTVTAGTGELDRHGFWEFPCTTCESYLNAVADNRELQRLYKELSVSFEQMRVTVVDAKGVLERGRSWKGTEYGRPSEFAAQRALQKLEGLGTLLWEPRLSK